MKLQEFFQEHKEIAVAFSGGVDSAYLLWAASKYASKVCAYFVNTPFQPAFELNDAKRLADELGVPLRVVDVDILSVAEVIKNPGDRCYPCKKAIFSNILAAAKADGFSLCADGTNASDDASDRPGMRALQEMKVLSPLRLCGLTKDEIRALSKEVGLFTHDKPAYACLATRIPTGRTIDLETLKKVEAAETALFEMGFSNLRVRVYHDAAKIQLPIAQMPDALSRREEIVQALAPHFSEIHLDLRGRA